MLGMMANSYDSERLRGEGLPEKDICDSRVAFTNENLITVYVNLINISVDTDQDYVGNRYNDHTKIFDIMTQKYLTLTKTMSETGTMIIQPVK